MSSLWAPNNRSCSSTDLSYRTSQFSEMTLTIRRQPADALLASWEVLFYVACSLPWLHIAQGGVVQWLARSLVSSLFDHWKPFHMKHGIPTCFVLLCSEKQDYSFEQSLRLLKITLFLPLVKACALFIFRYIRRGDATWVLSDCSWDTQHVESTHTSVPRKTDVCANYNENGHVLIFLHFCSACHVSYKSFIRVGNALSIPDLFHNSQ